MQDQTTQKTYDVVLEERSFITKVYGWMALALSITAVVAYYTVLSQNLIYYLLKNQILFIGLLIGEIFLVSYLSRSIHTMTLTSAVLTFVGYSMLNGITLSLIFLVYTYESIASTFLITGMVFGIMSFYGYTTKRDLTSVGNLCLMGLIGVIIASVVNMFFFNELTYWISTYIGILVFIGLVAYDTQKIKSLNIIGNEGTDEDRKESIRGALILYLDFINLFLLLLRIFGKRRN